MSWVQASQQATSAGGEVRSRACKGFESVSRIPNSELIVNRGRCGGDHMVFILAYFSLVHLTHSRSFVPSRLDTRPKPLPWASVQPAACRPLIAPHTHTYFQERRMPRAARIACTPEPACPGSCRGRSTPASMPVPQHSCAQTMNMT